MHIAIAFIHGNIGASLMARFLESFAPLADRFVAVRACGGAPLDDSESAFGIEKDIRTGRYHNAAENADWPHVDDFAAARNTAFDLAFSLPDAEWVMWADTDDIIAPESCKLIRALLEQHGDRLDMVKLPYIIPDQGITLMRERIIRKGVARWESPVHESLHAADLGRHLHAIEIDAPLTHLPLKERDPAVGNERNLRILHSIPREQLTTSQRYHLWQETRAKATRLSASEDIETRKLGTMLHAEADALTKEFLKWPEGGRVERYEAFLSLAITAGQDFPNVARWLTLAHAEDPSRREALGELAHVSLAQGKLHHALAYARQMLACDMPANAPWNLRRKFYGWGGIQLLGMCLRVSGDNARADALEFNWFKAHGAKISLLHATRGRGLQAERARNLWLDRAENADAIEHIFAIDIGDESSEPLMRFNHIRLVPGGGCVAAWNAAARCSHGDILIQVSDDWTPPVHWDRLILERFENFHARMPAEPFAGGETENGIESSPLCGAGKDRNALGLKGGCNSPAWRTSPLVLAISDGHRTDNLLCMAILNRARYLDQGGNLFHPAFRGVYSDNFFTDCAYADDVVIEARDIVFEHHHPAFTGEPVEKWDATHAAQNASIEYQRGEMVLNRLRNGILTWPAVDGWCDFPELYEQIAQRLQDGDTFVEVGSWMGQSIICLAQKLQELGKDNVRLLCVDTWKGEKNQPAHYEAVEKNGGSVLGVFEENIRRAGVHKMISPVIAESVAAAEIIAKGPAKFAGIFLDAAHDYESVRADLRAWRPLLREGGILAGHDIQWPEVAAALNDENVAFTRFGSCWVAARRDEPCGGGPAKSSNGD